MGFTDEEIVAALAGLLAECDGHNYGNAGLSSRIWNPTPRELDLRLEKDPVKVAALLASSLPLADTYIDPEDGLTKPYVGKDWASVGIFQQIPSEVYSWGWGPILALMVPEFATRAFYAAFRDTVQLPEEPLYYRVQKTQRSQYDGVALPFADNYRKRMTMAKTLFDDAQHFTNGGVSVIDP